MTRLNAKGFVSVATTRARVIGEFGNILPSVETP